MPQISLETWGFSFSIGVLFCVLFEFGNLVFIVFEVFALVALFACEAIFGGFAGGFLFCEGTSIVLVGEVAHEFGERMERGLRSKVCCDPKSAEVKACALRVDVGG